MATEIVHYITYLEAVVIHCEVMRFFGETHIGIADRLLIESALARPQQAAAYENASLFRQAATLCFGLIKNHPWVGQRRSPKLFCFVTAGSYCMPNRNCRIIARHRS